MDNGFYCLTVPSLKGLFSDTDLPLQSLRNEQMVEGEDQTTDDSRFRLMVSARQGGQKGECGFRLFYA